MLTYVIFDSPAKDLNDRIETIDLFFELAAITDAKTRFFPILVHTKSVFAEAPPTRWFISITLHFSRLTKLTSFME